MDFSDFLLLGGGGFAIASFEFFFLGMLDWRKNKVSNGEEREV